MAGYVSIQVAHVLTEGGSLVPTSGVPAQPRAVAGPEMSGGAL